MNTTYIKITLQLSELQLPQSTSCLISETHNIAKEKSWEKRGPMSFCHSTQVCNLVENPFHIKNLCCLSSHLQSVIGRETVSKFVKAHLYWAFDTSHINKTIRTIFALLLFGLVSWRMIQTVKLDVIYCLRIDKHVSSFHSTMRYFLI